MILDSLLQFSKALLPMDLMPSGNLIFDRDLQLEKALSPMNLILSGSVMLDKEAQPSNVWLLIVK